MTKNKFTKEAFYKEAQNKGFKISDWVKEFVEKVSFESIGDYTPVIKSLKEIGLTSWSTYSQIIEAAEKHGLEKLSHSEALDYALKYDGYWVYLAIDTITDSDGSPNVFELARRGDGLWLSNHWASSGLGWSSDRKFVFRLRKSLSPSESSRPLDSSNPLTLDSAIKIVKDAGYIIYKEI